MPKKLTVNSSSLNETKKLGVKLGALLKTGDVILLSGELGAGKTTIAKAISKGLGIKSDHYVVSPSYAMINEYEADINIYHFDLYRLVSADELYDLGAYEYFQGDGVCLIEWGDRFIDAMPEERLELLLEHVTTNSRRISMTASGKRYEKIISGLKKKKAA
jgi:tRNA threonylcarbamoyladenosine biosynthesis protein TsaE